MDARLLGSWGEAQAAEYLRCRGFRILAMNFRCRLGELDIVAEDRRYLVFVEVKLRKTDILPRPGNLSPGPSRSGCWRLPRSGWDRIPARSSPDLM